MKVAATHEAGWGKIMVQGSQQSFKDEWLVALFSIPLNVSSCCKWATAIWAPHIELPKLQTEELMTLTLSLLGLGGMRSFEKSRGVARESMKKWPESQPIGDTLAIQQ